MMNALIILAAILAALFVISAIVWLSMRITSRKSVEEFRKERPDATAINQGSHVP